MTESNHEYHSIIFGSEKITFSLEFGHRKNLEISVHPDCRVSVKAPQGENIEKILKKIKKRATWILKQIATFSSYLPATPQRRYISGETHLYRGRQYRLKIINSDKELVQLKGAYIWVYTRDKRDGSRVKLLLDGWYRSHAQRVFSERMEIGIQTMRKHRIHLAGDPVWKIRSMVKRWGSSTKKGEILLSLELIKASTSCIDYVIIHELCHLKVCRHDRSFYKLLDQVMPDWRLKKQRLEKLMA